MHDSLPYILIGLLIALSPLINKIFLNYKIPLTTFLKNAAEKYQIIIATLVLVSFFALQLHNLFFALCSLIIATYLAFSNKRFDLKIFSISLIYLFLSSKFLWWLNEENTTYEWRNSLFFLAANLLLLKIFLINQDGKKPNSKIAEWISFVIFAILAAAFSFNTMLITQDHPTFNWSAYMGPAEIMFAGARVFYDFPTQYGLGPTAILSIFHGSNPLGVMHYFDAIMLLLYSLAIFAIVFVIKPKNLRPFQIFFYYTITFVSLFFWVCESHILEVPSMQGPRLFPAVLMALIILLKIGKYQHFQSNIPIHLIWCFGVLWSPESAFYVTLIWWPYYLWTKYIDCKTEQIIPTLFKAGLVLIGWLAALLGTFLIIYYASYGIMPSLGAFFYYQMHPPGGMPINYAGPIWFFLGIISLAGAALYQGLKNHPNEEETHFIFITLLLLFGTASYFLLGRSHSSNLINISPIILISLIATRNVFRTKLGIIPTSIVLLSFISYGEFKNLGSWSITRKFEFDHKHLVEELSYPKMIPFFYKDPELSDLNRTIKFIKENNNDPISIMDNNLTLLPTLTDEAWNAAQNLSNFLLLTEEYRFVFVTNTMNRLQKSGWIVIDKKLEESQPLILEHFESIYNHKKRLDFGTYIAIHFTPKQTI